MKGRPIEQLVYEQLFPRPKATDPSNFRALLERCLVQEVRQEVVSFYGHLDTQEAKYPGLDYTHKIHRIRLSRWQWHRRLFRAFDALRLTPNEIHGLTKWEGTKWAKERFEREEGIRIRDTAADEFPDWAEPSETRVASSSVASPPQTHADDGDAMDPGGEAEGELPEGQGEPADDSDDEDDEVMQSVGVALNERLRERAARRAAGETTVLDEEWEQWLKNAIETGELSVLTDQILDEHDLFPQRMMSAARAGRWDEVPEFLRDMMRQCLDQELARSSSSSVSAQRAAQRAAAARRQSSSSASRSAMNPPTSSLRSTQDRLRMELTGGAAGRTGQIWEWPRRPNHGSSSNHSRIAARSGAGVTGMTASSSSASSN